MKHKTIYFENLCEQIGYFFNNPALLRQACTHTSYVNEQPDKAEGDNERLEFLGDAVLDLVISDHLMERFPQLSEGGLTRLRASLVSESGLGKIAESIGLGNYLFLGRGEELTGGRQKKSILSCSLEALIAAIYIDTRPKGIETVRNVILRLFQKEIPQEVDIFLSHDFKTELQEHLQKKFQITAEYHLFKDEGPDHQKVFGVVTLIAGKEYGRGEGSTKKQAEQLAAKETLKFLPKFKHEIYPKPS